ncbi:MAG TPA: ABC transporter permease [Levilinea sp.]|nr:ABC transporter permease [Levilinea sp.]
MSLRRIGVLLHKEIVQGPKNFIFIFGLVMPVILTMVLSLILGTFFKGKPRLGVVDLGDSVVADIVSENAALDVKSFSTARELEDAAERGAIDIGIVLPYGFDRLVKSGDPAEMTTVLWGESLMEHRITLGTAIIQAIREVTGQEAPVEVQQVIVGDAVAIPWEERILPFIVLISILMAGLMVPATSLVAEKTKHTLSALSVSPTTLFEIFAAKGLLGVMMSMFGGIMILVLNRAFTGHTLLLLFVLLLGALMSSSLGILLGAAVKDISVLFAAMKGLGIFLYGPAIVRMFPEIPQWTAQLFPTFYILQPVLDITQENASLADIAVNVSILAALIVVLWIAITVVSQRTREAEATV